MFSAHCTGALLPLWQVQTFVTQSPNKHNTRPHLMSPGSSLDWGKWSQFLIHNDISTCSSQHWVNISLIAFTPLETFAANCNPSKWGGQSKEQEIAEIRTLFSLRPGKGCGVIAKDFYMRPWHQVCDVMWVLDLLATIIISYLGKHLAEEQRIK